MQESARPPRSRKVLAYVVRAGRLLVFRHRDHPDAGLQVPAGTLEPGEAPDVGALRETEEETGRSGFGLVRKLGVSEYEFRERFEGRDRRELHERHVFLLAPPPDLPEQWSYLAEAGKGDFWFEFFWLPLDAEIRLAGDQHVLLDAIPTA